MPTPGGQHASPLVLMSTYNHNTKIISIHLQLTNLNFAQVVVPLSPFDINGKGQTIMVEPHAEHC